MKKGIEAITTKRVFVALERAARKNKARVWRECAARLAARRRTRPKVNLARLNAVTREGDVVAVPGKVLGKGDITHKIVVAALAFSASARAKLSRAECTTLSLRELVEKNPGGKKVRLIV